MEVLKFSRSNLPTKFLLIIKFIFDKTSRNNESIRGYYIAHEQI